MDSGIDSDADTLEAGPDNLVQDPDYDPSEEETEDDGQNESEDEGDQGNVVGDYNPDIDWARESPPIRLLNIKKKCWRTVMQLNRLRREADLQGVEHRIRALKNRQLNFYRQRPQHTRRRYPVARIYLVATATCATAVAKSSISSACVDGRAAKPVASGFVRRAAMSRIIVGTNIFWMGPYFSRTFFFSFLVLSNSVS